MDHLPQQLIRHPLAKPGQVAAVVLNPNQAYLGWLSYTVSPPAPQDLWYPLLVKIANGVIVFDSQTATGFMEHALTSHGGKEAFRILAFQSLLYQDELSDWLVERYHNLRESLWPNSAAPSA